MKIEKAVVAGAIQKLKDIVPKRTTLPALGSILYGNGDFIANNMETALTVKRGPGEATSEAFLIPQAAFDLICNLPDGEVDITTDGHEIEIRAGRIHNKFATWDVSNFSMPMLMDTENINTYKVPAQKLIDSIKHTIWAAANKSAQELMRSVSMQAANGTLNFYGLDGHQIAWDQLDYEGELSINVPKEAAQRITTVGFTGEVSIVTDGKLASFSDGHYILQTRLLEGEYFKVGQMFSYDFPIHGIVNRQQLFSAMLRIKMCMTPDDQKPVVLELTDKTMELRYTGAQSRYTETIDFSMDAQDFEIGFNPLLFIENLRAFDTENVEIDFSTRRSPAVISGEGTRLRTLLLPVNFVSERTEAKAS